MKTSLVLPTRNAEWCLPYSLRSVSKLDPQPDEIIVCIGKCQDRTEEIIRQFQRESKTPVSILYDKEGIGTGYAMNILITTAKNELVLWIDSDFILPSNWIAMINILFEKHNLSFLGSVPKEISPEDISTAVAPDVDLNNIKFSESLNPAGGMLAFKRSDALKLGNFDPLFSRGQDLDMEVRAKSFRLNNGVCNGNLHAGLMGKINFRKVITRQTFWKFFYKYGWKYCIIDKHHFMGSLLRHLFILSLIALIVTQSPIFYLINGLSIIGLVFGIIFTYKRFSFNLFFLQIFGSVGELCQIYYVLANRSKQKFGYGKQWLQ